MLPSVRSLRQNLGLLCDVSSAIHAQFMNLRKWFDFYGPVLGSDKKADTRKISNFQK